MKIACIGEAMVELSLAGGNAAARIGFAGDTLNTAIYLQRALEATHTQHSVSVDYVSVLGQDPFSDQIESLITSENISTALMARSPTRVPGLYAINTDDHGERSFTYWRDQSAARTMFNPESGLEMQQLNDFDLIYYSAITLAILPDPVKKQWLDFLQDFRQRPGRQVAFDSNYRPRLWDSVAHAQQFTQAAWLACDIALPSVDDEMALFGDTTREAVLARLGSYGISQGALKCAADGAIDLADPSNVLTLETATTVVDSTAAGDSFNGAYLACAALGKSSFECITNGHACAMRVIGYPGAIVDRALW